MENSKPINVDCDYLIAGTLAALYIMDLSASDQDFWKIIGNLPDFRLMRTRPKTTDTCLVSFQNATFGFLPLEAI